MFNDNSLKISWGGIVNAYERGDMPYAFSNKNFTLIMMLRYLMDNKSESVIANFLGLTPGDILDLKQEGIKRKLWDENWVVFPFVVNQYNEAIAYLNRKAKEKESERELSLDDRNNIFVPETFRGLK